MWLCGCGRECLARWARSQGLSRHPRGWKPSPQPVLHARGAGSPGSSQEPRTVGGSRQVFLGTEMGAAFPWAPPLLGTQTSMLETPCVHPELFPLTGTACTLTRTCTPMRTHTHAHTRALISTHAHMQAHMHALMHVHTHMHTHIHTLTHAHTCTYTQHAHTCTHAHTACAHTHSHTCTHVHAETHTHTLMCAHTQAPAT